MSILPLLADLGHHMEWSEWGWLWMVVMMAIGAIIVAIVFVVLARSSFQREADYSRAGAGSPLNIAKRRYAAGEIDKEEFERIRQDLGGHDS